MKTTTIKWQPFSRKHQNYIYKALKSKMSVAEGAIRSGKTIDHCIIACMYLEKCPDKIHLASGSTIANAKMNIGDCNGFGLEHLFRGRCRWGKYKDNEALYIQTQTGEKIVLFAGGGKSDSYGFSDGGQRKGFGKNNFKGDALNGMQRKLLRLFIKLQQRRAGYAHRVQRIQLGQKGYSRRQR